MADDRLPTKLWVDAHLHTLTMQGVPFYIHNTGNFASGMVMVKLNGLDTGCKLLQQQRDLDGDLGWMVLFKGEIVAESEADAYIQRAIDRDPDLWVIEVEDKEMNNPFEGKVF
ncbi:MAG: DUF1491 family protein [Rhodospirillales bacterium]|nr:DUF1491 family protein [Rhodospirillales bacterium]MCB9995828.1 DUF1491 family protein [Rhodospirillales bacterium]